MPCVCPNCGWQLECGDRECFQCGWEEGSEADAESEVPNGGSAGFTQTEV